MSLSDNRPQLSHNPVVYYQPEVHQHQQQHHHDCGGSLDPWIEILSINDDSINGGGGGTGSCHIVFILQSKSIRF